MKTRILLLALSAFLALTQAPRVLAAQPPAPSDLDKAIAAAATYEPGQSLEPFRQLETLVRQSIAEPALRPRVEAGLAKLLAPSATIAARRFACEQLGIIGSETSLPAIAELLNNPETAGFACLALTTYPPGRADDFLRAALAGTNGLAKLQIINTLGDRRDAQSVSALAQLACESDLSVAEAAIASLGKIGDEPARKTIAALRRSADPVLGPALLEASLRGAERLAEDGNRKAAIAAYEQLLAPSLPAAARRSAFAALLKLDKDQGEQRILKVIHRSDVVLMPIALGAVRSLRSPGASEKFAAELPGLAPEEQTLLVDSLAARGDSAATAAVQGSLLSTESSVRRAGITALGRYGDISAVPLLARVLENSKDPQECLAIESALASLGGGTAADQVILGELQKSAAPARVHFIAAVARRLGPKANPLLLQETENPNPQVVTAAFRALAKNAGEREVPALLTKVADTRSTELRAEAEGAATQAILRIENPARRSAVLLGALDRAQTVEGRSSLLGMLPGCGGAEGLAALKAASSSPEPPIREAAVRALAEWPDASVWDTLVAVYRQPKQDAVREAALRGLVRLAAEANAKPDAKLLERYRQLLDAAKTTSDFKLILSALGGAAHPDALQLALPLLDNSGVRAEAEVAVKKIAAAIKETQPGAAEEALQRVSAKP